MFRPSLHGMPSIKRIFPSVKARCISSNQILYLCFWVGKNMISIDLPQHIPVTCSGPAAVFAISSWRTRRLCASCKPGGGRVVLGRKKWLTGSSLGVSPREQVMLWDVFVFTPMLWRYYTWHIYSNHLDKPPASVFHPSQATEAVTICRETFANAFITDRYLKSESLNFNGTTCVTMVAKFLCYMSLWRWALYRDYYQSLIFCYFFEWFSHQPYFFWRCFWWWILDGKRWHLTCLEQAVFSVIRHFEVVNIGHNHFPFFLRGNG